MRPAFIWGGGLRGGGLGAAARTPKECSRGSGSLRGARCAVSACPKFAPNQESQPPQSVLIFRRVNSDSRWKAFVQTSQDSLGWVGGFENVNFYAARRWELPSCATFI